MKLRDTENLMGGQEVLGKRTSTATPIHHEMWMISLENLLMLYGKDSYEHVMEVHQQLKRRNFLTSWYNAPADAEIIFVSIHLSVLSLSDFTRTLHNQRMLCHQT